MYSVLHDVLPDVFNKLHGAVLEKVIVT